MTTLSAAPAPRLAAREPMAIPTPRGPVSAALVAVITGPVGQPPIVSSFDAQVERAVINSRDILVDDDLQLALFVLHALADTGIEHVDARWADDGILRDVRSTLESALDEALRDQLERRGARDLDGVEKLEAFLAEEATEAELDEFLAIAAVTAQGVMAPELVTALQRAGLDCGSGHYVDAVDVRVLTARTTATMYAATAPARRRPRGEGSAAESAVPLALCIAAAELRLGVPAVAAPLPPARTEARRLVRDARRLAEHAAAAHALDAWMHAESALRPCDLIDEDRVLSAAALAVREADVSQLEPAG